MQHYPLFRIQILIAGFVLLGAYATKAQSNGGATFTPAIDQELAARSAPAKVTSDEESALTSKGYIKIGTIRDSQPGKKANAEATEQLESAILRKATEAGGDVVRFSKEGAFEVADVPTGKTKVKGGTCDQYSTQSVSTTTSSQSCYTDIHGFAHCTTWNTPGFSSRSTCVHRSGGTVIQITKREKSLVSEGTVWRYDPKMIADIARKAEETREAIRKASSADVKSLLPQGGDINARDKNGYTALIRAIKNGKLEEAEILVVHGADVNEPVSEPAYDKGDSPLQETSLYMPGLMKLLVERGARVDTSDSGRDSPLFWAACGPDPDNVSLLVARGSNVNLQDNISRTPLMHAASCPSPHIENVKILLASGADKYLRDYAGKTAADLAKEQMGKAEIQKIKRSISRLFSYSARTP